MGYTAEGYKDTLSAEDKIKAIEVLKSTLGTMVQYPEFDSDPSNIGFKSLKGYIQKPILTDEYREVALNKLVKIIDSL